VRGVVTSVLLVDDHPLVRAGLAALLVGSEHVEVVGEAGDGLTAVELAARLRPDVVLMDLSMPVLDGVAATRLVVQESPSTRVVVLTSFADRHRIADAVEAGAVGFLLKDCDPRDLVGAVRSVAHGTAPVDPRLTSDGWWQPSRWLSGRHRSRPGLAARGGPLSAP
jgi:DNA-binding NarL/FixJ family response regulator